LADTPNNLWSSLWSTPEQQAQRALDSGNASVAAKQFTDPRRRAYAEVKAGNYADAAKRLAPFDDATSQYNRGNALAHSGDLPNALSAYDAAIKQTSPTSPIGRDAKHNRDLVAKQLEQKKQSQQKDGQKKGDQQSGKNSDQTSDRKPDNKQDKNSGNNANDQQDRGGQQNAQNNANPPPGKQSDKESAAQNPSPNEHASDKPATPQQAPSQSTDGQKDSAKKPDADQAKRDAAAAVNQLQQDKGTKNADRAANQSASNDADARKKQPVAVATVKPPTEQSLALDQWLRQIPDDPGGLLRRKFLIEHMLKQHEAQQ
jgi:Ca-activated chloride channel family protein